MSSGKVIRSRDSIRYASSVDAASRLTLPYPGIAAGYSERGLLLVYCDGIPTGLGTSHLM